MDFGYFHCLTKQRDQVIFLIIWIYFMSIVILIYKKYYAVASSSKSNKRKDKDMCQLKRRNESFVCLSLLLRWKSFVSKDICMEMRSLILIYSWFWVDAQILLSIMCNFKNSNQLLLRLLVLHFHGISVPSINSNVAFLTTTNFRSLILFTRCFALHQTYSSSTHCKYLIS